LDTDGGWLTGTPRLPRHLTDGLTCDGALTPVWTTRGHPVNVGDTQRVVPHRSRVLVLDRDRGCRFPGCGASSHVEVHHLTHWRDGGPTDLPNLLSLCPHHHDGHHRGEFTITGDPTRPDGLTFHTRTGLTIGPPGRAPVRRERPAGPPDPDLHDPSSDERDPAGLRPVPPDPDLHDPSSDERDPAGLRPVPPDPATPRRPRTADRSRPRSRLGRSYPAPTGGTLHLNLVDFTPPRRRTDA
jgi:hypothetical protein